MRSLSLALLAIAAHSTHGFTDTSPFFFFSTAELLIPSQPSIQSASSIDSSLSSALSHCPSQFYIIASQLGVNSGDYADRRSAPSLAAALATSDSQSVRRSAGSISDVVGEVDGKKIEELLHKECGAAVQEIDYKSGRFPVLKDASPRVFNINYPSPSPSKRAETILAGDAFLASFIDNLPSQNYTVMYMTTPKVSRLSGTGKGEPTEYEMDESSIQEPLHQDLKRAVSSSTRRNTRRAAGDESGNFTLPKGPLFERYQYLTPGLFMSFLVALPLLLILYVAIRALASLEVSYAAFDKETGPGSAQGGGKKVQ